MKRAPTERALSIVALSAAFAAAFAACANVQQALESAKPMASQYGLSGLVEQAQKGVQATTLVLKAASDITPDQEYYIGRGVSAEILSNPKFAASRRAEMEAYVTSVGQAIALGAPSVAMPYQGYRFVVLESPTVNAVSVPGGYVFVTTGAVLAAQSEEELAGVLAHEIAHVSLKHGLYAIKQSNLTAAGTILAKETAKQSGTEMARVYGDSLSDVFAAAVTNGYSREQELAADRAAAGYLAEVGYSSQGLLDYLKRNNFDGGGFRSDHPSGAERVAALQPVVAAQAAVKGVEVRTARFQRAVRGAS